MRACGELLAELVRECVKVPRGAILVPLPTIGRHIRERGFDHTKLLAKHLARNTSLKTAMVLMRSNNTTQVGANEKMRKIQAEMAYHVRKQVDINGDYILVDDVWTTGSSMLEAAKRLRERGITKIGAMIIAKSG